MGNRTPDSAVRGLRLNLLTNTPYSLFIYAVQRKIYYTEELPSCPVLFLFFSKLFLGAGRVRGCRPAGVCVRKPNLMGLRAGVRKLAPGRRPGMGVSVGRSLRTKTEFSGFAGRRTQTGTGAPAGYGGVGRPKFAYENRIQWVCGQAYANRHQGAGRPEFAYENRIQWVCGQAYANRHRGAGRVRGCRPAGVCSQLPAKPYPFVSGSKFFTQLPAGMRGSAGVRAGRFAPLSPLGLIPSFRGANSSHNFRPENAASPASRPARFAPLSPLSLIPSFRGANSSHNSRPE